MCPSICEHYYTGLSQGPGPRNDGGAMLLTTCRPGQVLVPSTSSHKSPASSDRWVPRPARLGGAHEQGARPVHDRYVPPVAAARVTETVDSLPDAEIKSGQSPANVSLDTRSSSQPGSLYCGNYPSLKLSIHRPVVCPSRQSIHTLVDMSVYMAYMSGKARA